MRHAAQEQQQLLLLLAAFVCIWVLSHSISDTNLDPYGDMLENFAWGQSFSWGNDKHPPLVGWVAGIWFRIFPELNFSYHILSYGTAALGLLGVYRLGISLGLAQHALAASLLLALSLPFSTLAVKFNANSILVGLWPWVAVAWLASLKETGSAGIRWSLAFGVLAALAVLGKYYSGLLLLSMLVASIMTGAGRQWLSGVKPWLALIAFIALLTPHMRWLADHEFVTFTYVAAQGDGTVGLKALGKFALAPVIYWLIPWLLVPFVAGPVQAGEARSAPIRWLQRMLLAWRWQGKDDLLFWLAILPWLLSLLVGLTGFVTLSMPWAMPLGFGFSLLWLRNLGAASTDNSRAKKVYWGWLLLVLIVSPIYAWQQSVSGQANYYLPRQEAAAQIVKTWNETYPGQPLNWVAGPWPEHGLLAFYGDPDIEVLDNWHGHMDIEGNGIYLCPLGYVGDGENVMRETSCEHTNNSDLSDTQAVAQVIDVIVEKQGFRFALQAPYHYRMYIYLAP